jgi:hypothetical protein
MRQVILEVTDAPEAGGVKARMIDLERLGPDRQPAQSWASF